MPIGPSGPSYRRIHANTVFGGFPTPASLTTALTGSNNDVVYTAKDRGTGGNGITVAYIDPPGNNAALGVSVTGKAITVNLATDGSSVITSTADDVKAAVEASTPAAALVTVADAAGNDGSGLVTALAATGLTGGTNYVTGSSR